jgi:hypothetical protein
MIAKVAVIALCGGLSLVAASVGVNFSGINLNQTIALGTGAIPPDMGMAVGPGQIVQLVNGGYQVYDKTGAAQGGVITDSTFWNNAGIATSVTSPGISDPRVIFDQGSGHFFASQINVSSTGNQVLLGVSNTSNPLDGWKAVNFRGNVGFADFPMLGLDQNGVYVSTNNFASSVGAFSGVSVFSIPKSDLLLGTPTLARLTGFENLNANTVGFGLNPAIDFGGNHGAILAISNTNFNQAVASNVSGSGGAGATLSSPTVLTGLKDGDVVAQRQPDGTRSVDGGDDRFGSAPFVVGNLLYATNTITDNNNGINDSVHWLIEDLTTHGVLAQGLVSDPNFDFSYSSIAANANGDFLLGFNRSGGANDPTNNISAYAEACHYDGTTATCENPLLLAQGLRGDYHLDSGSPPSRWGDYSSIAVDPTNPNTFWTALEIPIANSGGGQSRWGTQITQINLNAVPEPGTFMLLAFGGLLIAGRRSQGRW